MLQSWQIALIVVTGIGVLLVLAFSLTLLIFAENQRQALSLTTEQMYTGKIGATLLAAPVNRWITRRSATSSKGRAPPLHDAALHFPSGMALLEREWRTIAEEAAVELAREDVVTDDVSTLLPFRHLKEADGWRCILLSWGDRMNQQWAARSPHTAAALRSCEGISFAMLSILAPGAVVPAHCGAWRGSLRYELGLSGVATASGAELLVASEAQRQVLGKAVLSDPTFPHALRAGSSEQRVTLHLHVTHRMKSKVHREWLRRLTRAMGPELSVGRALRRQLVKTGKRALRTVDADDAARRTVSISA